MRVSDLDTEGSHIIITRKNQQNPALSTYSLLTKNMSMTNSERGVSSDDSSCSFGLRSTDPGHDVDNHNSAAEPDTDATRPSSVVFPANDLIDKVAAADCLFDVVQLAFVEDPVFYQFNIQDANRFALANVKVDVDGWKVSFVPRRSQGWFDFIKVSQDPEVLVFRRPKPITRLLWKNSSQHDALARDLSAMAGVKIGRMNRYGVWFHCAGSIGNLTFAGYRLE